MEKELENSGKKKRRKQPKPAQSAQPGRAPALSDRRTLPVSGNSPSRVLSLPRSLPSGASLSVPVFFPTRSLSLSVSRARSASRRAVAPHAPFSSLCAVDRRVRTRARRWISRPRRPPTRPAPFLEPRQCPTHTPHLISRSFALSRALLTLPAAAGDPRPRSQPSNSLETAPSLSELRPEVRHLSPCPISLNAPCARPISPSPVLGRGGPPCSRGGRPI
jgi:hypothetical protein